MKISGFCKLNKTSLIMALLFLSVTGLFLAAWSSYIHKSSSLYLPLVFLALAYSLIILLGFYLRPLKGPEIKSDSLPKTQMPGSKSTISANSHSLTGTRELITRITDRTRKGGAREKAHSILQNFAREFDIMQGVFYQYSPESGLYSMLASYALTGNREPEPFSPGTGIHGQAALDGKMIELSNLPESFTMVMSGLGRAYGKYLYLLPFLYKNETIAMAEFTVFNPLREDYKNTLSNAQKELGEKWNQLIQDAD